MLQAQLFFLHTAKLERYYRSVISPCSVPLTLKTTVWECNFRCVTCEDSGVLCRTFSLALLTKLFLSERAGDILMAGWLK